ncbi:acyltransferase family protein [Aquicoccus sp.]|uniref:acyltransferase family protein n=1 Tax=Aquicoccus sp. TaxID=2055851 RepID=UPI0035632EEC
MGATWNIDTLRILATVLLVAYHVIGINSDGGMEVADNSGWRFAADLLRDLRMPLFAFIAGAVYALRPLSLDGIAGFTLGKGRRLVVPGVIASLVFWVLGNTVFSGAFSTGAPLIEAIAMSYGHFWFLQALLILFLTVSVLDAALRYRAAVPLLVAACILNLVWHDLAVDTPRALELTRAVYLAPGFLIGMILIRHGAALAEWRALLALAAAVMLAAGLWLNLEVYRETGSLSRNRMDMQSLLAGAGAIILLYMATPRIAWCDRIAVMAFTIYLYHPFGTSLARRLFESLEIDAGLLRFTSGLIIGFGLPVVLHVLAHRFGPMRRLLLGLRASSGSRKQPDGGGSLPPN